MLVSKRVQIRISSVNKNYWWDLGYVFADPSYSQRHKLPMPIIEVSTDHIKPRSNIRVECWCERCEAFFTKRFSQYSALCKKCTASDATKGNNGGMGNKGKKQPKLTGELHPRWNPNKTEFKTYSNKVNWLTILTYRKHKETINPNNYPRTLCGVEDGFQLDHIVSVKHGFDNKIDPRELAKVENLQMLPWKENRTKWHKSV